MSNVLEGDSWNQDAKEVRAGEEGRMDGQPVLMKPSLEWL